MKVIVIGASTSGLYTAYLLAREGIDAELYERMPVLGLPRRTLITTHKLVDVLGFVPKEAVLNKIKYIEVFSRSRSAQIALQEPDLVVEREKLIQLLARMAENAGAKIIKGHEFLGFGELSSNNEKIAVRLKNLKTGEVLHKTTDILVGADGHTSTVSSTLEHNRTNVTNHITALLQARVSLPSHMRKDTTKTWFDSNLTRYFIWLIPESEHTAVAGTIADSESEASDALMTFLSNSSLKPMEFQSAQVPLHHFSSNGNLQSPSRNVFIVGDAAGQVKATTVGGLVTGLRGATALSGALLNGRHYHRELRSLKRELDLHLLARSILNKFCNDDYDKLLSFLNGKLCRALSLWSRDELSSGLWSLVFSEPRLVTLGLKTWLRKPH